MGNGATLKLNSGLRLGAFTSDGAGGYTIRTSPSDTVGNNASPGSLLSLVDCVGVEISNLTLDGNGSAIIYGAETSATKAFSSRLTASTYGVVSRCL